MSIVSGDDTTGRSANSADVIVVSEAPMPALKVPYLKSATSFVAARQSGEIERSSVQNDLALSHERFLDDVRHDALMRAVTFTAEPPEVVEIWNVSVADEIT